MPEVRGALARRRNRLRANALNIAQTAVAASAAWALAGFVNARPFFAPVSAVISLGVARGRRTTRAIELVLGVAVGIAVADLIVLALGTGTLVIALVVALSMLAALLLGAGNILVNQAAVSAILIATIQPPSHGIAPTRFIDALIGGAVALLVGQVLFPRDPMRAMGKAARPVLQDLALGLHTAADALRDGDVQRAERALEIVRAVDDDVAAFFDAVTSARETHPVYPGTRRARERLPVYAEAARQLDFAVRNTRVLARRVVATVRRHGPQPEPVAEALDLLAAGVQALESVLEEGGHEVEARRLALRAAARATSVLSGDLPMSTVVVIGQIRSTAIDLLQGSGLSADEAHSALDAAADAEESPTEVAVRTTQPATD
jgi:uncharacterized membrane protein YgaE (UPF0421/DUF939 family)